MDLFAPGSDLCTTISKYDPNYSDTQYATVSGTSVAAPMVAGAAVLMASATGNRLTGTQLKALLRKAVDVRPDLRNLCISGVGMTTIPRPPPHMFAALPGEEHGGKTTARPWLRRFLGALGELRLDCACCCAAAQGRLNIVKAVEAALKCAPPVVPSKGATARPRC